MMKMHYPAWIITNRLFSAFRVETEHSDSGGSSFPRPGGAARSNAPGAPCSGYLEHLDALSGAFDRGLRPCRSV